MDGRPVAHTATTETLVSRGVYCPPVLSAEGFHFLVIVNRHHAKVAPDRIIWPLERFEDVCEECWNLLDLLDPPRS